MQALQQEIAQAEAKVAELRQKLHDKKSEERAQAIATVKELVKLHDLTAQDLGISQKKGKAANKSASKSSGKTTRADKGIPVPAKYKDPASGSTWSGRGRAPVWLATLVSSGRSKNDYLIDKQK